MTAFSKYLSALYALILCSFVFVSCGGNVPDPDPEPDPELSNYFVVLDKKLEVKSAGLYHSEISKGYHFVVSSEKLDLTGALTSIPKGTLLIIDIPELYSGKECDIFDVKDVFDADHVRGWCFFIVYTQDGTSSEDIRIDNDTIKSGKIAMTFDLHSIVSCKMSVTLKDGKKLECVFEGRCQKSDSYICNWGD